jgi:hypothetical protein
VPAVQVRSAPRWIGTPCRESCRSEPLRYPNSFYIRKRFLCSVLCASTPAAG